MRSVGKHYRQLRNWHALTVGAMLFPNLHAHGGNLLRGRVELIVFPLDRDGSTDGGSGGGSRNKSSAPAPLISAA
ncbi:hypothetical protein MycrhN_4595 [Mycolicibacterium rhodesiae NBB3]|uniref:Uncharacterized protein n=1 Tax=Mycolicibacterium rhodesiae (strain NBB3) TaxID=710685 RepID=G8RP44_MYCRN|nr:hypothetical protein MycrhN_4595 [Mycolicibacterium rhodesiae NBB3]